MSGFWKPFFGFLTVIFLTVVIGYALWICLLLGISSRLEEKKRESDAKPATFQMLVSVYPGDEEKLEEAVRDIVESDPRYSDKGEVRFEFVEIDSGEYFYTENPPDRHHCVITVPTTQGEILKMEAEVRSSVERAAQKLIENNERFRDKLPAGGQPIPGSPLFPDLLRRSGFPPL